MFYIGILKGVGRVYQQYYVDTCAKAAFARLYITKTPITAADLFNEWVLPFLEEHELLVLRILTDRGTEFCGKAEHHDYRLYVAVSGICERFHKTILQEFYQLT